jgi:hypothetical protein
MLLPKPSGNFPPVTCFTVGTRRPWSSVLQTQTLSDVGTPWRTIHLTISRDRFYLSEVQVLWSWQYRLRIWASFSVIRGLPMIAELAIDVGFMNLVSNNSMEQELRDECSIQFYCHLYCNSSVLLRDNPSQCTTVCLFLLILNYAHLSSLLVKFLMSCACRHNLRNCLSRRT